MFVTCIIGVSFVPLGGVVGTEYLYTVLTNNNGTNIT
jgi:hypothetical protein